MEMLGGGDGVASQCRKPEIMADAAYVMLTKDSRSYTGNFAIDDEVLRADGVTDMDQYACVPGWFGGISVLQCILCGYNTRFFFHLKDIHVSRLLALF